MHDGVWSALAEALAGDAGDSALRISNDDASSLRDDAAPYLTVDVEHGQTIYRLAHRTFAEHFTVEHDTQADDGQQATDRRRHVAITHKLIDAVEHGLNPYLVTYVSAHAAAGGEEAWQALADRPGALDHLDPRAVTADAMRSAFGRFPLPAHIAGTISAAQQLAAALPADRPGRRQLAAFRYAASDVPPAATDPHRTWSVPWAVLARETTRLTLTGHDGAIHTMTTFPGSEGNIVLATGGHDGTVRLWDPAAGTAVGEPLAGHIGAVRAVTSFAVDNDRHLLASGGQDRIVRLWDPAAGIQVGELVGHTGFIRAMATFVDENGTTLLVTGGLDRAIRIWDPVAGSAVGDPLVSDVGDVCALATFVSAGRTLLAVAGGFGDVRIWDPVTGTRVGEKLRSFVDGKQTLVVHEGENTEPFLATANQDGRIRLWDWRQIRVIDCLGTPYCSIFPLTVFTDDRGRPLLTGGEGADTVVFWDPARERIVGEPLTGHMGAVRSATAFAGRHGQPLLATGSRDGAVRIWAPTTEPRRSAPDSVSSNSYLYAASSPGPVDAIVAIPDADGRVLLAARRGVSVKVFDPAEPARIRHDDRGHGTRTIAGYTSASGAPVLASGDDGGLKLHDLSADSILGSHWVREKDRDYNRISAMTIFTNHDGRPLIGCGLSNGEILAWDPVRDERIYRFIAHSGRVETLTTLTFDDGEVGLVSGGGGSLWIWEANTGNALWNATYARLGVRSAVALRSPERRLLLVAVDGGSTLHMCDVAAKRQVAPPDDLKDGISAIASVPCADGGSLLATATADRMVRLWDLDTMTVVQRVGLGARALALTALDSHRVAVGLADGLAVIELGPS